MQRCNIFLHEIQAHNLPAIYIMIDLHDFTRKFKPRQTCVEQNCSHWEHKLYTSWYPAALKNLSQQSTHTLCILISSLWFLWCRRSTPSSQWQCQWEGEEGVFCLCQAVESRWCLLGLHLDNIVVRSLADALKNPSEKKSSPELCIHFEMSWKSAAKASNLFVRRTLCIWSIRLKNMQRSCLVSIA